MTAGSGGYTAAFYDRQRAGSARSARIVLPIVFAAIEPQSVVDVGCGVGTWLSSARRLGASRAVGIDGDWVRPLAVEPGLEIQHRHFEEPIALEESFDLALCLEVAEHLSPKRARGLVSDLTELAPNVLFSAAIPRQGGHLHLNEQWQSYWAELFAAQGYGARDIVRPQVRWHRGVEFWYRQNAILYSRDAPIVAPQSLDLVHPFQRLAWGLQAANAILGLDAVGDRASSADLRRSQ
jgi:SAM-dependent methyltransferase